MEEDQRELTHTDDAFTRVFSRHHTDDPLMKVLIELFQKLAGSWGSAPSRLRRGETLLNAVLFGSFSCGYIAKKKYGNGFLT